MGYINVLYGGYKKVIKRLMYFSPPTECFYEHVLSTSFTQYCLSLCNKGYSLF